MGPINVNYQPDTATTVAAEIYHFAHHHPLQLSRNHNPQTPCSACLHPTSTTSYACQHCNYYLHSSCSKMPQQLQHPVDTHKTHLLRLFTKPVYAEGKFNCDACGHDGSGFSYHCGDCRIDLHVLCAALPAMVSVQGHEHQLTRVFAPPYVDKQFVCDVCKMPGSKTWLYSCGTCQYDVHLGCIRGTRQSKVAARSVSYPPPQAQPRYYQHQHAQSYDLNGYGRGHAVGHPANNPMVYYIHQTAAPPPKPARVGVGSQLTHSIGNGIVEGASNALAQAAAAAALGAFFGGGDVGGGGVVDFGMVGEW